MLAKRRCYCNNCGTEFRFQDGIWDDDNCPVCGNDDPDYELIPIPDYETSKQYEKRTGKPVSNDTVVWCLWTTGNGKKIRWIDTFKCANDSNFIIDFIVIADPPVPPPNDWKPEEV
jgi:hypothetical protein